MPHFYTTDLYKMDSHKQKLEDSRSETAPDAEIKRLQRELDDQLEKECLLILTLCILLQLSH